MNKLEFRMDIPAVTREYTPGSCRNSRKHMRLCPPCEMRPDSPALCPEQLRFPNQTRKEPRFACATPTVLLTWVSLTLDVGYLFRAAPEKHSCCSLPWMRYHQMVNTKIRLIIFFAAKDGEALYSQQKQDQELTVAHIMNSLLPNSDLNWRK